MPKRIVWTNEARSDLRRLDRETALHLLHALARFVFTGEGDVRRLQAIEPAELRLRVGDYRIRFYDKGESIEILHVLHRREAYRR